MPWYASRLPTYITIGPDAPIAPRTSAAGVGVPPSSDRSETSRSTTILRAGTRMATSASASHTGTTTSASLITSSSIHRIAGRSRVSRRYLSTTCSEIEESMS